MSEESLYILAYLAGANILQHIVRHLWRNRNPPGVARVGTVNAINIFPVKSMGGLRVPRADCSFTGLSLGNIKDRIWIVAQPDKEKMITAEQEPKLVTIATSLHGENLHLDADGHNTLKLCVTTDLKKDAILTNVKMWDFAILGVDCGDEAANWINSVLGKKGKYRILHHVSKLPFRNTTDNAKAFNISFYKQAKPEDKIVYHDSAPFSFGTDVSLTNLNARLEENIPAIQFRHSIEISSMCEAFDEDSWKEVFIGGARFTRLGPIDCCLKTTVSPQKGNFHPKKEPLTTLRTYRCIYPELGDKPAFGRLLVLVRPGSIQIGDPVFAIKD